MENLLLLDNLKNNIQKEKIIKIITRIGKIIDKILTLGLVPHSIKMEKFKNKRNIYNSETQKILCSDCGNELTGNYCNICGK